MQSQATPSPQYLGQHFADLIWSSLDAELLQTAVFYAERYHALDNKNHDAIHLYATALLRVGQPHSAYGLVNLPADTRCGGCLEVKSRCCSALGRHKQAREALEEGINYPRYGMHADMSTRTSRVLPVPATLHCRSGSMALKANTPAAAVVSFRQALAQDPSIWEAFEGLCAVGKVPPIDDLFPPRALPIPPVPPPEQPKHIPTATGNGFFTPDTGNGGNLFRNWRPVAGPPRDSLATIDSSFYAESSLGHGQIRASRSQPTTSLAVKPPAVRPLSSADEAGPVAKKPRSTARQRTAPPSTTATDTNVNFKPSKSAGALFLGADDRSKSSKARARPALTIANIFSSSGRRAQNTATSSRSHAIGTNNKTAKDQQSNAAAVTRRSTRLLSGSNSSKSLATKHGATRDRRRVAKPRLRSMESDEEEPAQSAEATLPASPPGSIPSIPVPISKQFPSQIELEHNYQTELAEYYVYELMRTFARAARALALYDCRGCLDELEKLPTHHQRTAWVMATVGKAHYEIGEYAEAERAFEAVRNLDPYRIWDMEVYSTLLWHLQKQVKLSFLAQELLNINPRSAQAWIAVGNCFSFQKERAQALTCFRRATQLDPTCAYAYTLSGHESIDDDLDKAITFFESALRADPRHYNAWYGLGTCYMRMSKLRLADFHFQKAAHIHTQNAVLLGCVAMVRERCNNRDDALALYNQAIEMSPDNALVRYRRAKIFISLKQYKNAVEDLERLRDSSPDEFNVIFQLARVYRLLGDELKSAQLLAVVRDVSPKSANKIRKLLETVKDEGDEVMDEG